jgi:putative ABC transport system ATP-binding protein
LKGGNGVALTGIEPTSAAGGERGRGDGLGTSGASLAYTDGERTTYALREVTVALPPGRFYGIMGPSGSGKSSLMYVLSGLKLPTSGDAYYRDFVYNRRKASEVAALRRERFGFVFQQPFLLAYLTALENILVAAPNERAAASRDKALVLLEEMGLGAMGDKYPAQLSGGEKQRVAVIRAMMNEPEIIFADEPTAALDHANGRKVVDALARWRSTGTVVVVTHDPEMLSDADEVIYLRDGELTDVRQGPPRGSGSADAAAIATTPAATGNGSSVRETHTPLPAR